MSNSSEYWKYFEQLKVDEWADRLRAQGYELERDAQVDNVCFDILARKGAQTLAFEVMLRPTLESRTLEINDLRQTAVRHGYEFRLIVTEPPHRVEVTIDGLEEALRSYFQDNPPSQIEEISGYYMIDEVVDLDFRAIHVHQDTFDVDGNGVLEATIVMSGRREDDSVEWSGSFPMTFTATVDKDVSVLRAPADLDTRDFYGDREENEQ